MLRSVHDDEGEDDHTCWMPSGSYKLGKFVHSQTENRFIPEESKLLTRRVSTSSLTDSYSRDRFKQDTPQQGSTQPTEQGNEEMKVRTIASQPNPWLEAHSKWLSGKGNQKSEKSYQKETPLWLDNTSSNNTLKESPRGESETSGHEHVEGTGTPHSVALSQLQPTTAEDPASIVAQRAERFGGAKKYGLRRVQSFQISQPNHQ